MLMLKQIDAVDKSLSEYFEQIADASNGSGNLEKLVVLAEKVHTFRSTSTRGLVNLPS